VTISFHQISRNLLRRYSLPLSRIPVKRECPKTRSLPFLADSEFRRNLGFAPPAHRMFLTSPPVQLEKPRSGWCSRRNSACCNSDKRFFPLIPFLYQDTCSPRPLPCGCFIGSASFRSQDVALSVFQDVREYLIYAFFQERQRSLTAISGVLLRLNSSSPYLCLPCFVRRVLGLPGWSPRPL